jgi:hypothetical protein
MHHPDLVFTVACRASSKGVKGRLQAGIGFKLVH